MSIEKQRSRKLKGAAGFELERVPVEFQQLLDALPAAAYTCDADGLITYYNAAAAEMWGKRPGLGVPEDRYSGPVHLRVDGERIERDECWMALALKEGRSYRDKELEVERDDGTRITGLAHVTPIFGEDGHVSGALNVVVDYSDRKRAEEALKEADRRKDLFLSVLGQEMRAQLEPIRNAIQLLRDPQIGSTRERAGAMLQKQLEQMVNIIDDVMDVSMMAQHAMVLNRGSVDLATIVRNAVGESRRQVEAADQKLSVTIAPEPIQLYADATRLTQAVVELIGVAAAHTGRGGRIWVFAESEGRNAIVKVCDTGAGVPADSIGLTLVQGLIELHGGTFVTRASNNNSMGNEYIITLPLALGTERISNGNSNGHGQARILEVNSRAPGNGRRSTDSMVH